MAEFGVPIPGLEKGIRGLKGAGAVLTPSSLARGDPVLETLIPYEMMAREQLTDRTWVMGQMQPLWTAMEDEGWVEVMRPLEAASPFDRVRRGGKPTGQWEFKGQLLDGGNADVIERVLRGDVTLALADGGEITVSDSLRAYANRASEFIDIAVEQFEAVTGDTLFEGVQRGRFFPRLTLDPKTGNYTVQSSIGGKSRSLKPRLNPTMNELIESGRPYATAMQSFELYIDAFQKMTRDSILAEKALENGVGHKMAKPKSLIRWLDPDVVTRLEDAQGEVIRLTKEIFSDRTSILRIRKGLVERRDQLQRRLTRESEGLGKARGQEDIRTQTSGRGQTELQDADLVRRQQAADMTRQEIKEVNESIDSLPDIRVRGRGKNVMPMTLEQETAWEAALIEMRTARKGYQGTLNKARGLAIAGSADEAAGGLALGPAFSQTLMPKETLQVFKQFLDQQVHAGLKTSAIVASWPRFLQTGIADVGHFGIQLSLLAFSNPKVFAKAAFEGIRAIPDPKGKHMSELMNSEAGRYAMGRVRIDASGSELTEAARGAGAFSQTGAIGRIPVLGSIVRGVPRGFDAALLAGRIHEANSLGKVLEKGWTGTPAGLEGELRRLGGYIDTKLGTPNVRSLGLSQTQDSWERAFLFYSNRYTRSTLGMLGWAFAKGVPGRDARDALAKTVAGAMVTFYGMAKFGFGMSDEDIQERLNPASGGKFMSLPIGGNEYGFGSGMRANIAFVGALTQQDNWDFDNWEEGLQRNPITRYLRGKTSPVTSTLVDFILAEDFLGDQVGINEFIDDPELAMQYGSEFFTPFNVRAIWEARGGLSDIATAVAVETVGGRTSPRSGFSLLEEARETEFESRQDKSPDNFDYDTFGSYDELHAANPTRSRMINETDGIAAAQETIDEDVSNKRMTDEQRYYDEVEDRRSVNIAEQETEDDSLRAYWVDRTAGVDPERWRKNTASRTTGWIGAVEALTDVFGIEFDSAVEEGTVRWGIEQWYGIEFEDFVDDVTGEADITGYRNSQLNAIAGLTQGQQEDVRTFIDWNKTGLQREHGADVSTIEQSGYWQLAENAWQELRNDPTVDITDASFTDYERRRRNEIRAEFGEDAEDAILARDGLIKAFNRIKKGLTAEWLDTTPNVTEPIRLLKKWGYSPISLMELGIIEENQ